MQCHHNALTRAYEHVCTRKLGRAHREGPKSVQLKQTREAGLATRTYMLAPKRPYCEALNHARAHTPQMEHTPLPSFGAEGSLSNSGRMIGNRQQSAQKILPVT